MINICCYKCGILFSVPDHWYGSRKKDGDSFWCPNGHSQRFIETTEAKLKAATDENVRLKERLAQKNAEIADAHAETEKARKEAARVRKRIDAGVCPCCNRTFQNLAKHMKTQHPAEAKPREVKRA